MGGEDRIHGNSEQTEFSGKVKGSVAIVVEVGVLKVFGVVPDYALDEGEVVEVDGAPETDGHGDHGLWMRTIDEEGHIFVMCRCWLSASTSY